MEPVIGVVAQEPEVSGLAGEDSPAAEPEDDEQRLDSTAPPVSDARYTDDGLGTTYS